MKQSYYTFTFAIGADILLYNAMSGALAKLSKEAWEARETDVSVSDTLKKQGFFVDEDVDELALCKFKYYQGMFAHKDFVVMIAPTMQCNFDCPYCFEGEYKRAGLMDDTVEDALVAVMTAHKKKKIHITWYGGEPLLGFKRMLSISHRLAKEAVDYESHILTNGSLLSEEKIAQLDILHLNTVQISMDGVASDHDKRRCYKNGTPSFQHIIANLSLLLERTDVKVNVKVALDKQNAGGYDELKAFLSERFSSYMKSGQLYVSCSHVLDKTGFDACGLCYTREELFQNGISCLEAGRENPWFSLVPQPARACMFRQPFSLNVDSEGYMYHCMEQFGNPRYRIGNIKNKFVNFSRLAQGMFAKDPFDDPECRNCKVLPLCGGGCPMDRLKYTGTDRKEPDYCSIYRGRIEKLIFYMYDHYIKKQS